MDFLNQIFDYLIEIYPNILNKNPISFNRFILNNYIHGDINVCREKFSECYSDVSDDELKELYLQLMAYMYSRKSYDVELLKYFHTFANIGQLMKNDFIFQYKIFTLSFDNIKLFKFILYSTDKWYEPFSFDKLRTLNQDRSSTEQTQNVATEFLFQGESTTGGQFQNAIFTYTDMNEQEYEITVEVMPEALLDRPDAVHEIMTRTAQNQAEQINMDVTENQNLAIEDNEVIPQPLMNQEESVSLSENRDLNMHYNNNYENFVNSYQDQTYQNQIHSTDTNNFYCPNRQNLCEDLSIVSDVCQNCVETENSQGQANNIINFSCDQTQASNAPCALDETPLGFRLSSLSKRSQKSETDKKPAEFNESNYLLITLILGGKWHVTWFLDWMQHNNRLGEMKDLYRDYAVWFAIYNSKFECAQVLKKYNFQDNFMFPYKYKCLDEYEYFKTIRVQKGTIFFKSNLFMHLPIDCFKSKFKKIHCSLYKKFLLGSDEESLNTLYDEKIILDWNMEILYYLDFPKKVILMAIQDLCIESNHLFCSSIEHIEKHCRLIMKKEMVAFMRQIYNMRVRDKNQSKIERMIVEKIEALSLYKKLETKECMICFDSFQQDSHIKKSKGMLSCQHFFHNDCLMFWRKEKNQCPYCRKEIYKVVVF